MKLNRRQFVLGAASAGLARGAMQRSYSAEMPNMLLAYFERKRAELRVKTRSQDVHAAVHEMVQEMSRISPAKSPQNTTRSPAVHHTVRRMDRAGYRIENILFQGHPDSWIPANFYLPTGHPGPFPGIVIQRGHFDARRMSADYQQLYFDLVQNGFAVLSFDPVGQGERRQHYYLNQPNRSETFDELLSPTLEHCAIGGLLSLIGESAAGWFVFDAMRAVDYLQSRKEVDDAKIGCADHTDTGWSALYHCVLDERIRCASLHVHGTGRRWPIDINTWNTTDDAEQWLFPAARYGIDLPDVMASLSPRPLQILVEDQSGDFDHTAGELRASYSHAAETFSVRTARAGEDWPKAHRVATVEWFRRWLGNEAGAVVETEVAAEKYESLLIAGLADMKADGVQDASRENPQLGKSVYSMIAERARNLPPLRTPSGSDLAQVKDDIGKVVGMPAARVPLDAREISSDRLEGYTLARVEFVSEPGIYVPAPFYRAAHPINECVVYVEGDVITLAADDDDDDGPPKTKASDRASAQEIAQILARKGYDVLLADVRGMGATRPRVSRRDLRGPWEHLHGSDAALANLAGSLGDSLLAMRVRDVLRAVEYAAQFGKVHVAGVDMGAVWALFAGALDPRIESVTIQRGLASYRSLMDHGRYSQAVSQFVPGILQRFDLPQVAGAIAPRRLTIIDPTGHMDAAEPIGADIAEDVYSWTEVAYMTADAGDRFQVVFGEEWQEHVGKG
jgi:cephalosporin-C deacetylase-like acetyl esterase